MSLVSAQAGRACSSCGFLSPAAQQISGLLVRALRAAAAARYQRRLLAALLLHGPAPPSFPPPCAPTSPRARLSLRTATPPPPGGAVGSRAHAARSALARARTGARHHKLQHEPSARGLECVFTQSRAGGGQDCGGGGALSVCWSLSVQIRPHTSTCAHRPLVQWGRGGEAHPLPAGPDSGHGGYLLQSQSSRARPRPCSHLGKVQCPLRAVLASHTSLSTPSLCLPDLSPSL